MVTFAELYYPYILSLHIGSVLVTVSIVVLTDLYGLAWVLGKKPVLREKILRRAHALVWTGLIITMSAGFFLFFPYGSYLVAVVAFRFKLFFVALLCLNAFFIGRHMKLATTTSFAELGMHQKRMLIASGIVSSTSWIGALIAAQMLPL